MRKSLPEPGQMGWVAEEARLCSCWPKRYDSVMMHGLAHCHNGGTTRSCFSTQIFFFSHFLSDISALWANTSDSLFSPDVGIHSVQYPQRQRNLSTWLSHSIWTGPSKFSSTHCEDCIFISILYLYTHVSLLVIIMFREFSSSLAQSETSWQMATWQSLILCQKSWDKLWNYPMHV
jgi:hypothetical protein